ncbi:hypothetical protein [Aureimonas leprariae]|uniref:hypothetical protein n=1 Tax=Plantimonas leprariae TaxID=2615207 RepID=UPI001AEEC73D|nr:hypothetical protein [Aureimonas leprariae]
MIHSTAGSGTKRHFRKGPAMTARRSRQAARFHDGEEGTLIVPAKFALAHRFSMTGLSILVNSVDAC